MSELTINPVCGIYGLYCKPTGKWYIGQSLNIKDRWKNAYKNLSCRGQIKIYRALKKYGYDQFDKIVLEETASDKSILNDRETYWCAKYDSVNNGYNIRAPGTSGRHSLESRMKMSKSKTGKSTRGWSEESKLRARGRVITEETRAKISAARRGQKLGPQTAEHRAKIAERARNMSDEWRAKISSSLTGKARKPFTKEHRKNLGNSVRLACAKRNQLLQVDNLDNPATTIHALLVDTISIDEIKH